MKKFKYFKTESGNTISTAQFDGYLIGDRLLEGLMIQISINTDGTLKSFVKSEDEDYFNQFNTTMFLKKAVEFAEDYDLFEDPQTNEECTLIPMDSTSATNVAKPTIAIKPGTAIKAGSFKDVFGKHTCDTGCGHDHSSHGTQSEPEKEESAVEEVVKEPVIGKFKPKRKYLNFVQGMKGGVRLLSNVSYVKSEQLTGTIEDTLFKITICDEGTINFEEVGTNHADDAMIQRFIDEIDDRDVTGYMKKFVVHALELADDDGRRCYLEVEHTNPIDKLFALFDNLKEPEMKEETTNEEVKVSDSAISLLDSLFGDDSTDTDSEPVTAEVEEAKPVESYAQQMMREAFEAMNAEKVTELSNRIEKKEKDITKYKFDIKQNESNLKAATDDIKVLYSRFESLKPADEPNGYVFFVSEENKSGVVLDQALKDVVKQISPLLKLKEDAVIDYLTKGFYTIKIAKKDDLKNDKLALSRELYDKINKLDITGKVSMVGNGEFEYRGDFTWHKIVDKMVRAGFEQDPEFDKMCGSSSYGSEVSANPQPAETQSEEFIAKDLIEFKEPTDLVIIDASGYTQDGRIKSIERIEVTDDESSFTIHVNGKEHKEYTCLGFVDILTMSEYKKMIKMSDFEDMFPEGFLGGVVLPGFTGKIQVSAKLENGQYSTDFNPSDYIQHQLDGYCEVIMNLPEGTAVYDINDDYTLPLSVIRDGKIEQIIK